VIERRRQRHPGHRRLDRRRPGPGRGGWLTGRTPDQHRRS